MSTSMVANNSAPSTTAPTTICVFCAASPGKSPSHLAAARSLAHVFAQHKIHLIYGGGTMGMMGEVARTLVSLSGPQSVHGIIPEALVRHEAEGMPVEQMFGKTTIVGTMHERKHLMMQLVRAGGPGSGFIALSGGYGTMEELMEVTTWNQLGIHDRGIVLYNVDGYWNGLVQWINDAVGAGFVKETARDTVLVRDTAEGCVAALRDYRLSSSRLKLDWEQK